MRVDRRTLAFEINVITFALFISCATTVPTDVLTTKEQLLQRLTQFRESGPFNLDLIKRITAVIQAVDKNPRHEDNTGWRHTRVACICAWLYRRTDS